MLVCVVCLPDHSVSLRFGYGMLLVGVVCVPGHSVRLRHGYGVVLVGVVCVQCRFYVSVKNVVAQAVSGPPPELEDSRQQYQDRYEEARLSTSASANAKINNQFKVIHNNIHEMHEGAIATSRCTIHEMIGI